MSWAKVDDGWWCHPKVMGLPLPARGLWISALSWSCAQRRPVVPRGFLMMVGAVSDDADTLASAGLWICTEEGWEIHDWAEYQELTISEKRADAGRKGGQRKAAASTKAKQTEASGKQTSSKQDLLEVANGLAGALPGPTRPIPTPKDSGESQTEEPPAALDAAEPPPEVDIVQEVNRAVRLYSQTKASQEVRANGGDVDRLAAVIGKATITDGRAEDLRQLVESGMSAEDAAAARADGLFGITSTVTPQTVSEEELQAQRDQQEAKRLEMLAAAQAERDAPRGDTAAGLAAARAARLGAAVSGAHQ